MKQAKPARDIDEYIARFPDDVRSILNKLRNTISNAAPDANEVISYQIGMPLSFAWDSWTVTELALLWRD